LKEYEIADNKVMYSLALIGSTVFLIVSPPVKQAKSTVALVLLYVEGEIFKNYTTSGKIYGTFKFQKVL